MPPYVPRKGDFITLTFDPQSGHEQKGQRPALVISNTEFNRVTGLAVVCPLTTTNRAYPFHVSVGESTMVEGFIMVEQVKSVDYRSREARRIGKAPESVLEDVLAILEACLY